MKISSFLALQRDRARSNHGALADALGDAILLDCSPFCRRLRVLVRESGIDLVAARTARHRPRILRQPGARRIEFIANVQPWLAKARDVDVAWLPMIAPPNFIVRDSAWAIARALLGQRISAAVSFLLAEAFAETIQVIARFFVDE